MAEPQATVLIVEDEESFVEALVVGLKREGFLVKVARDGAEALEAFDAARPDVVLLDVMLPKVSGIDVCRQLRSRSRVPIIMVTAKGSEIDTVVGLEVGADDYVTKPYRLRELVARMRAVLRRAPRDEEEPVSGDAIEVGDVRLDPERHEVFVRGESVNLPLKEFELLADFEIVEREIPEPAPGHVRIRVQACGVCHSDVLTKEGFPGIAYPRVPGHEIAGVIDEAGAGVTMWKKGQRVGVGWHGGQDGTCLACRRGDFGVCANLKICGVSYDGGYQEYVVVPVEALAQMPESLDAAEAGPLMCAGVTTFNALRHSGALPSDLVAVQGIGGLGHLGIQFANKFGYRVAAVGRGSENAALAKKLGAHVYIDSKATDAAAELRKLGGARVILATAPDAKSMSELASGLGDNGKMMVVGATNEPIEITPLTLIFGRRSLQGWPSGIPTDSEDTLRFSEMTGVRPMIEKYPLEKAAEAYGRMMSGKAEFRVVLTM